jgi:exopolysaccharide biosynthesis WecB/TagA/CpsF family protein
MIETRIRIFYPADPVGVVPGGVDTFLRGLIKSAPQDLSFSLVGMTTDPNARPVGQWTRCRIGERTFEMHPVCSVADAGTRRRIPLSVRFMAGVNRDRLALAENFDCFDFHRVEPALMWAQDLRPKNMFFHQDPGFVRLEASDNLWRHLPRVYERIEQASMRGISSAWCVRETGVQTLRERYPALHEAIRFVPTWVDPENFFPVDDTGRAGLRLELSRRHGIDASQPWVVSVGRLDTQKDPQLMLQSFARLHQAGRRAQWLVIGDGVLRAELQRAVEAAGLGMRVHFLGLQAPSVIADLLRASDVYALSSAYEGMPMALLEGLGCGLPAVVTDVGEVRRVVRDGINGRIAEARDAHAFANALADVLDHAVPWRGAPALQAVEPYQPMRVLGPVYDGYRRVAAPLARLRERLPMAQQREPGTPRTRQAVVGVPIDVAQPAQVHQRLLTWAARRESRYACFVNVHSAVQATRDERHRRVLLGADLAAPDGAPIAWTLRAKGHVGQPRLDGPGTMWRLLELAQQQDIAVGLYGGQPQTLEALRVQVLAAFPGLRLEYMHAPPFRELSEAEDEQVCRQIEQSGVGLLFVSLGCPKQEYWMASHRGRLSCVMLGVGAAFEFHAGQVGRAPPWMRDHGLEWLHRLASQPGRLWRRYAYTNSLFLAKSAGEALRALGMRVRITGRRPVPPRS